ncbi:MAG: tetratricopeptide repeat protein [Saprospiraceae bacterium]|jgi:tetratricopeptide (TPR) repeat protein|nr:tetratricopeptide repeat protein [Saprospiraceae bacterium]MBK6565589.1 tetratricopeptide repeat protein [Saprospiraceae bacterium]MBK6785703.1 tetratricopeptide repeat protein [Saprospiraceae bacterium]MBK7523102.1 tetratricopeptide repeat protein [Saprospiraceae bacterium]MBK8081958.1 tetratricopeptide repeat protein [Saprospiraceae bacterium]
MNRLEQLKEMNEADPDDAFVHYALAKEYEYAGMPETALECYNGLMKNHPQYVGLYYHLGSLLEKLSDPQKALVVYEKGISIAKELKDFHALSELQSAKMNLETEV